jgi:cbb3-type cytochrome oxidase cytochrome c subunit
MLVGAMAGLPQQQPFHIRAVTLRLVGSVRYTTIFRIIGRDNYRRDSCSEEQR